jgi:hypothetical protein
MLVWNETDILSCLEVVPEKDPDEIWHKYTVEQHGLRLELTIYQYDGDIYFDLFREGIESTIFSLKLVDCPGLRYINNGKGEYLEFAASQTFGSRYDGESVIPYGVRVRIKPHLSIEMY